MSVSPITRLRGLARDVSGSLRGHDIPLYAAGLTFYSAVALIPLLLLAIGLATMVLGGGTVARLGAGLATVAPDRHGVSAAIRDLAARPATNGAITLVGSILVASLYGEGLVRALDRLSRHPERRHLGLRGRLMSPMLIVLVAVLLACALAVSAQVPRPRSGSLSSSVLAVYLSFLIGWAGATVLLLLVYRAFSAERPGAGALVWGSLAAGSWLSGQTLGFVLVLALPLDLGRVFAGSDALGAAAIVGFWLYFSHVVMLVGYLLVVRLDARHGNPLGRAQQDHVSTDAPAVVGAAAH